MFLEIIKEVKFEKEEKEEKELLEEFDYKRLYEHYIKELFIYNGYWSKKEYFFKEKEENKINDINNDDNNNNASKLKYKQLSYYTRNYQQPILYPILQYDKYIPNIKIDRGNENDPQNNNIYNHKLEKIVKYNFSLSDKMKDIFNPKEEGDNKQKAIKEKTMRCCLVKKMYHVKGIFYLKENKNVDKKENPFSLIFISDPTLDSDKIGPFCHFELSEKQKQKKIEQCYGSILPCCKKECNKKYIIESKNIMFLIERSYYMKTSAIEIFTYEPYKSYYFNFKDKFKFDKIENNENFHKIEDKNIILYYNNY